MARLSAMGRKRQKRTTSGGELIVAGALLTLFGAIAVFFVLRDGGLGAWAPGWFLALAGTPVGIGLILAGLFRRRRERS